MIYTKQANFPYPLLCTESDDYQDAVFELEVELMDNQTHYILNIENKISSTFLKKCLTNQQACLILLIKSADNQFYYLDANDTVQLYIPKTKLSFGRKTTLQLMIKSEVPISFAANTDVNGFYAQYMHDLTINKGFALGFSNTVIYTSERKPHDLFEKKLDPSISSELEIKLTDEVITIIYRDDSLMLADIPRNRNLLNPYLYIGLQRALMNLLTTYADDIDEGIELDSLDDTLSPLHEKLVSLLKSKWIVELSSTTIDHAIHCITDGGIFRKYVERIGGLTNGN